MREIHRRDILAAGAGLLPFAGLTSFAIAQTSDRSGSRDNAMGMDPVMAGCLLVKGRRQIEVCHFVMDKLHNDECKRFCQAEIDEHEHIKQKLGELGYQFPSASGRTGVVTASRTDGGDQQHMTVGRASLTPGLSNWMGIDLEVLEQCVATAKAELGKLQGAKMDKCFIGDQLHMHYGLFDHAVVFKKHATRDLGNVLEEGRPIIEKHISMCKSIMEKLDNMKG